MWGIYWALDRPFRKKHGQINSSLPGIVDAANNGQKVRDEGNLYGRVKTKSDGSVSVAFYYRFRFAGQYKDISCGSWPKETLSNIRRNRDAARSTVREGIDPSAQKRLEKLERQEAVLGALAEKAQERAQELVVADLFEIWIRDGVRRAEGNAELIRSFNADVLPLIGNRPIQNLDEHDLRAVPRAMVARGINRSAIAMRHNLAQMFAWAVRRQPWRKLMAEGNPMELIEIEKIISPDYDMNHLRDRILLPEIRELHQIFKGMHERFENAVNRRSTARPLEAQTEHAVWIMLSTMCRVGELSMTRWEHVDMENGEWFIPLANTKGKQNDFVVFLSPFAIAHFSAVKVVTGKTPWCFPGRGGISIVDVRSISKQVGDRQACFKKSRDGSPRKQMSNRTFDNSLVLSGGIRGAWTPHDLRRTGAKMMQGLGVSLEVIDRCQNHVLAGSKVRRHYLHHDYAFEKAAAWQLLGRHFFKIPRGLCQQSQIPAI